MKRGFSFRKKNVMEKLFKIVGEGIIRDYLRNAADKVVSVEATEPIVGRLQEVLPKPGSAKGIQWKLRSSKAAGETVAFVRVEPWDENQLERALEKSVPPRLIFLDHILDPRNLGAIVRTCAFFGFPYVIAPRDRQVLLTEASVATAQAGFSVTQLVVAGNLLRCLERCRDAHDFWIVTTDAEGETDFADKSMDFWPTRLALVLGNEEKGVSKPVRKAADISVRIGNLRQQKIDSLNVSVAAGILIHHFSRSIS